VTPDLDVKNKVPAVCIPEHTRPRWQNFILMAAGFLAVGLGVIGIFLPVLPTTPFLLLAAYLFARSSKRYYHWLLNNRWFGHYLCNYRAGQGIPRRVKLISISLLWISILISGWLVSLLLVRIILLAVAVLVSWHILALRTTPKQA